MLYHHPPHPQPPRPVPTQGFLMQKIIACERRSIPCLCTDICLNDCDLTSITSICAAGAPSCWSIADGCTLRITLPLNVCACDACGHCRTVPSSIDVETTLPRSFAFVTQDAHSTLLILPCIRLLRADCTQNGCFRIQLAISLEIFLLRYETLCQCKPQCPQLPLYPQPIC